TPLSGKVLPPSEARSDQQALREMYRSRFGLEMHPLQNERSMVPPAQVINAVQGKSKSDPDTFLGSGWRDAARIVELLHCHGYDMATMNRMLDFGVGTGRVLLQFLPFQLERHGCDVNPAAVEWTSRTLGKFADIR